MSNHVEANKAIFRTTEEYQTCLDLCTNGQSHLFDSWSAASDVETKRQLVEQIMRLNGGYPGGLLAYAARAKALVAASRCGDNTLNGVVPAVPQPPLVPDHVMAFGGPEWHRAEAAGIQQCCAERKTVFCLVAGGLGERLGYHGIKVALTSETASGDCFLQQYAKTIIALNDGHVEDAELAIMTSEDTDEKTRKLLEENDFFGLLKQNVHLMKQQPVAALMDATGKLAMTADGRLLQMKPHGHGDVHKLLLDSGVLARWMRLGKEWMVLFQDTNAMFCRGVAVLVGESSLRGLDVNLGCIPRKAKESIGAICHLNNQQKHREAIACVEYCQLDSLLKSVGGPFAAGDVAADPATGLSPFPGNINEIVLRLGPYKHELERSHGLVPEFINPKWSASDPTKTMFASSARLECMMQDYPLGLQFESPTSGFGKVGATVLDTWVAFSPVKNSWNEACAKTKQSLPPYSALSGELDQYSLVCKALKQSGTIVGGPIQRVFGNNHSSTTVDVWPLISIPLSCATTWSDLVSTCFIPGTVEITAKSSLVVKGDGKAVFKDLYLDGALVVTTSKGHLTVVSGLRIVNKGWEMQPIDPEDTQSNVPEDSRLRGFVLIKHETHEINQ